MLILLSPAKTLDFVSTPPIRACSEPELILQSIELAKICKQLAPQQLASLMKMSDSLAALNTARFTSWHPFPNLQEGRPAIYAFQGGVYQGLAANSLTKKEILFTQQHLRILSGLYGLLRPLDNILPYRLEMGTKLANNQGNDLYHFWNNIITNTLQQQIKQQQIQYIINLASAEYAKAINFKQLSIQYIQPVFLDKRGGEYKIISFFAKKARGLMSRFIIQHQLSQPSQLKEFDLDGYTFCQARSDKQQLIFLREQTQL